MQKIRANATGTPESESDSHSETDAEKGLSLSARAMARPVYLDDLNDAQSEAVTELDGPVLVLAGAGPWNRQPPPHARAHGSHHQVGR